MTRVVGFEGSFPAEAVATWGAAALSDGEWVWNAYSGLRRPAADSAALFEEGGVWPINPPIDLREGESPRWATVVAVRYGQPTAALFIPGTEPLARKRQKGIIYYVLPDRLVFDRYASEVATAIVQHVLERDLARDEERTLVHAGLAFRPHDPFLHAVRVLRSDRRERSVRISEAALRSERDRRLFHAVLAACAEETSTYLLKYENGIAHGGGLEVGAAAEQFAAIRDVDGPLRKKVTEIAPFLASLDSMPSMRCTGLRAASAGLEFSVSVKGEGKLAKIARYLQLEFFQDAIRGNISDDLASNPEFMGALRRVVAPTPETSLYQRPLGAEDIESVTTQAVFAKPPRTDAPVRALGFIAGARDNLRNFEVRLAPGVRELVSAVEGAHGASPKGAEFASHRNDFLFIPAICILEREVYDECRTKFRLQSIQLFEADGAHTIDAVPSGIVRGAFLIGQNIEVRRTKTHELIVDNKPIGPIGQPPTIDTASSWLEHFAKWAAEYELTAALDCDTRWLPAIHPRNPTVLERVCVVLYVAGDRLPLRQLCERVYVSFATLSPVRNWQVVRLAERFTEYITYDGDAETMTLTTKGEAFARAYLAASATTVPTAE